MYLIKRDENAEGLWYLKRVYGGVKGSLNCLGNKQLNVCLYILSDEEKVKDKILEDKMQSVNSQAEIALDKAKEAFEIMIEYQEKYNIALGKKAAMEKVIEKR